MIVAAEKKQKSKDAVDIVGRVLSETAVMHSKSLGRLKLSQAYISQ